jgi:hypothetical protein
MHVRLLYVDFDSTLMTLRLLMRSHRLGIYHAAGFAQQTQLGRSSCGRRWVGYRCYHTRRSLIDLLQLLQVLLLLLQPLLLQVLRMQMLVLLL